MEDQLIILTFGVNEDVFLASLLFSLLVKDIYCLWVSWMSVALL